MAPFPVVAWQDGCNESCPKEGVMSTRVRNLFAGVALAATVLLGAPTARADIFMLVEGAVGGSANVDFPSPYGEVELVQVNVNGVSPDCALTPVKRVDSASPTLIGMAISSSMIPEIHVVWTNSHNEKFFEIFATHAKILQVSQGVTLGPPDGGPPLEQITIVAKKLRIVATSFNAKSGRPEGEVVEEITCGAP
jgi:hypothetical protein